MKWCSLALLLGAAAMAQTPGPKLVFEVASVRPAGPNPDIPIPQMFLTKGGPGTPDPGQINYSNVPMRELLRQAYGFNQMYQLSAPAWMENARFDIVAKVPAGATRDDFKVMLQNLLAERFDLVVHHETRDLPGYEMTVAKGGLKVKRIGRRSSRRVRHRRTIAPEDGEGPRRIAAACAGLKHHGGVWGPQWRQPLLRSPAATFGIGRVARQSPGKTGGR